MGFRSWISGPTTEWAGLGQALAQLRLAHQRSSVVSMDLAVAISKI